MKTLSNMKRKDVSDSEIEQAMRPILQELSRTFIKRAPSKTQTPETGKNSKKTSVKQRSSKSGKQAANSSQNCGGSASVRQQENKARGISKEELDYLKSILEYPNLGVTARGRKLFGFSADKMTKLKNNLAAKELIKEFSVDLGKAFGGRVKMLKLTEQGYKAIDKEPPAPFPKSQGSFEHIWWQVHIAHDYAKRGYRANIERPLNGKPADVGVSNGKELVAVEVELTPKNVIYNFKADIDAGFSRVIIACKNQRVRQEANRQIESFVKNNPSYSGKHKIILLHDFPFVMELMKEVRGE